MITKIRIGEARDQCGNAAAVLKQYLLKDVSNSSGLARYRLIRGAKQRSYESTHLFLLKAPYNTPVCDIGEAANPQNQTRNRQCRMCLPGRSARTVRCAPQVIQRRVPVSPAEMWVPKAGEVRRSLCGAAPVNVSVHMSQRQKGTRIAGEQSAARFRRMHRCSGQAGHGLAGMQPALLQRAHGRAARQTLYDRRLLECSWRWLEDRAAIGWPNVRSRKPHSLSR